MTAAPSTSTGAPSDAPADDDPPHDDLPASFGQERLWFFQQFDPLNAVYNATLAVRLAGAIDLVALQQAFDGLVARHEALRTTFAREGGTLVQRVATHARLPVVVVQLAGAGGAAGAPAAFEEARRRAQLEVEQPFDLEHGPLVRVTLLQLDDRDHVLVVVMHHIVSDGWSMGILLRELDVLYTAAAGGTVAALPELPIQYGDFASWQREWLDDETVEELLQHWRGQLAGAPQVLELPTDRPRPPVVSHRGESIYVDLERSLVDAAESFGAERGATTFMTMLAGFYALLHRITTATDLVVGTPVTGRPHEDVEGVIGFFVNTLALRVRLDDDPTFSEIVARTREVVLDAIAHQDLPFERLVDDLQPERDRSYTPLVQAMFALQNPPSDGTTIGSLSADPFPLEPRTVPFDLLVEMIPTADGMTAQVGFAVDLFESDTVERMMRNYVVLLAGALAGPDVPVSRLAVLAPDERTLVVETWNTTGLAVPAGDTVHAMVERRAAEQPDALAVSGPDGEVTYAQLDAGAGALAGVLAAQGVGLGDLVCVYAEPGVQAVTAMLAVMKAGAAYVPIDPDTPPERLAFIVGETGSQVVLTQRPLAEGLPPAALVLLDDPLVAERADAAPTRPPPAVTGEDAAYAIFTSGSTGRPKGVLVRHRNLCNLVHWHQDRFGVGVSDRMGQTARLGFDASVWEVWSCLCLGGSLHVVDRVTRIQPAALREWIVERSLTQCQTATLLAERLIDLEWPASTALRHLSCGGEKLVRRPRPDLPFELHDMYGPTECTVISVCDRIDPGADPSSGPPPIGRPVANTQVYVLDRHLEPLPIGAVGEICIGGDGVSLGYLCAPAATAASFLPHPWSRRPGDRMYRTGDLGRFLPDGRIEIRGRIDDQVKVRGFRIELGEVQSVLERDPAVTDAVVVLAGGERGRHLVAYVVPARLPFDEAALRASLRRTVPEYMVPSVIVAMDALPTSAAGKVDRAALPPPPSRAAVGEELVAPRTPAEEAVAAIWSEVLGQPEVGVTDKFFDVGGNSLGIVDVHERLQLRYPGVLTVADLFEHATVEAVAAAIDEITGGSAAASRHDTSGFEL